ncbi:hypothetical protein [Bacteriovorax sp. Seq25_V]|uniref:hypothetical protein n=1 Tax=Bacteriovorax sp. Seq25_V TaxID=1201288 RepID=UPI00038A51F5|nr:hypothetical protein [Bacteriovorax sp. Seq25_V]EQC46082.1 hypothetical protein M900_1739 [Bacteriovorax sp. Seq25_V]
MRLARALEEKLLDLRLRDKLIAEGKVTKAQVEEYLNSLTDDEDNSEMTEIAQRQRN